MKLSEALIDSLRLLLKEPKLFLPKLFVAAIYGFLMLWSAAIALGLFNAVAQGQGASIALASLLPETALFFLSIFAAFIIDVFVSAMYPSLAKNFEAKEKVSLSMALGFSLKKSAVVLPAAFFALIVSIALIAIPSVFFGFLLATASMELVWLSIPVELAIIFATDFIFFYLFAEAVLGKGNFLGAVGKAFGLSGKNKKLTAIAALIPFSVSLMNYALAFLAETPAFLFLFILMRFFMGLLAAYAAIVSPTIYLGLESQKK
ncbi:MAG: hypothetical protein V1494_06080 [Candidatus Diapherotrites archaeon]